MNQLTREELLNLFESEDFEHDLSELDLSGEDLSKLEFFYMNFRNSNLAGVNLTDADLTDSKFDGANLSGANLTNVDIGGARLSGAILDGVTGLASKEEEMMEAQRILNLIQQPGNTLDMSEWHTCDTSHCIAGWSCPNIQNPAAVASRKMPTLAQYFYISSDNRALEALKRVANGKESIWNKETIMATELKRGDTVTDEMNQE